MVFLSFQAKGWRQRLRLAGELLAMARGVLANRTYVTIFHEGYVTVSRNKT
ncbi:hypothetical protein [Chromobacterium haemolyticum]|uniref:hypothetical protein n=1 Tax=Chromobacterium haemolyticum TaxID=394935 RepID=UPI0002FF68EE|nr:hypothetical protein [Chromobacterium haemolyticum]